MKHRAKSSKIKYEHRMINGLRTLLEEIEPWDEIKSIIPAEIRQIRRSQPLSLQVQYPTHDGLKCLVKSGNAIQEVFIVTPQPVELQHRLESLQLGNR